MYTMIKLTSVKNDRKSGCGGMADASDSKSDEGDFVRVQVPPSASKKAAEYCSFFSTLEINPFLEIQMEKQNE